MGKVERLQEMENAILLSVWNLDSVNSSTIVMINCTIYLLVNAIKRKKKLVEGFLS